MSPLSVGPRSPELDRCMSSVLNKEAEHLALCKLAKARVGHSRLPNANVASSVFGCNPPFTFPGVEAPHGAESYRFHISISYVLNAFKEYKRSARV